MLDAMIAFALKRLLDKHIHFRKRVSVEEQRAQNTTNSYEETNCLHYLRAFPVQPELMKRYKDSQICSVYVCRMTTSKTSTFDVIELYCQQAICLQMSSQNDRTLFSFRLFWLCTTKKLFETMNI